MMTLPQMLESLITRHPVDTASLLGKYHLSEVATLLQGYPPRAVAKVFLHLTPRQSSQSLSQMETKFAAAVCGELPRVHAAVLLRRLPAEQRERISNHLAKEPAAQLKKMMDYPEAMAGSLADPLYLAMMEDQTVDDARRLLSQEPDRVNDHIYVLDRNQLLAGYVTVKTLACSAADTVLLEIRQPAARFLSPEASLIRMRENKDLRRFDSLPVVDRSGIYLGALRRESLYFLGSSNDRASGGESAREAVQALGELYQLGLGGVVQTAEKLSRGSRRQEQESP